MALDYGERRIGVAITDPTGMLAQPLETVEQPRRGGRPPLERIAELVDEYQVEQIVVGLPVQLSGRSGEQAAKARSFGERVAERTAVPVEFIDERWTSVEARRVLRETGVPARKQRGRVDPVAAALLLRTWLERQGR
jgi:putative Holliday junction resolvase